MDHKKQSKTDDWPDLAHRPGLVNLWSKTWHQVSINHHKTFWKLKNARNPVTLLFPLCYTGIHILIPRLTDFLRLTFSLFSSYKWRFRAVHKCGPQFAIFQPGSKGGQATQGNGERWGERQSPSPVNNLDCLLGFWDNQTSLAQVPISCSGWRGRVAIEQGKRRFGMEYYYTESVAVKGWR